MKNDLKKKFLEMLFEEEEETVEIVTNEPSRETNTVKKEVKKPAVVEKPAVSPKPSTAFIDLDEKPLEYVEKVKTVVEEPEEEYEIKGNVSPIFGSVSEKPVKTEIVQPKVEKKETVSNNSNMYGKDYIGTIISPIFGLDHNKANEARLKLKGEEKEEEKVESVDVTSKLNSFFEEDVKEVKYEDARISLFDEPFDEPVIKEEAFQEPFTSEFKVIKEEDIAETYNKDFLFDALNEKEEEEEFLEENELEGTQEIYVAPSLSEEDGEENAEVKSEHEETISLFSFDDINLNLPVKEKNSVAEFDFDDIEEKEEKSFIDEILGD